MNKTITTSIKQQQKKISALSSGKIDKCEEILPPQRHNIIEKAKYPYLLLGIAVEKQVVAIEEKCETSGTNVLKQS